MKISPVICLLPILLATNKLLAQQDSIPDPPVVGQEIIEDYLQNIDSEGDFDFNDIFDQLQAYLERPLNLNKATENELQTLQLLSDIQILNFLNYRRQVGPLISILELQTIPSFDLPAIRRLLPYVTVGTSLDDFQVDLGEMLVTGRNELQLRWTRTLEEQKGFSPPENPDDQRYLGDPNQLYFRYRHKYFNRMSYGLTAEKDRGETFFKDDNKNGFDYYSAHFYLQDYRNWLQALAIGDYNISFGQGLVLYSGFGYGKSSYATNVKRGVRTIRPYASVNEANFMRGAALTVSPVENLSVTAFASSVKRDANLGEPDTLFGDFFSSSVTSFNDSGFHRTPNELEDEDAIQQFTTGGSVKYKKGNNHIAINALYDKLDKPLIRNTQAYNQFAFNGDQLLNLSMDYSLVYKNFNFFGETAMSDNGAIATINGLLLALDRKIDMAIVHRYFPRDYQALNANPFAESSGGSNEEGIYFGLVARPLKQWEVSAYYDQWQHPWLRFQLDAPSRGEEYRVRVTYTKKRRLRIYGEVRREIKAINAPENETPFNYTIPRDLLQTRLHIGNQLSKSLELRTRVDWGCYEDEVQGRSTGFVVLQDVLYKPLDFPLSFTTRFALFDTGGYQIRFYHYENNLLNTFAVPPYYNRGTRFYLNLRYRPKLLRNLTIEGRFAQTYWNNRDTFGSGLDEIDGQQRTQLSAQLKYVF